MWICSDTTDTTITSATNTNNIVAHDEHPFSFPSCSQIGHLLSKGELLKKLLIVQSKFTNLE